VVWTPRGVSRFPQAGGRPVSIAIVVADLRFSPAWRQRRRRRPPRGSRHAAAQGKNPPARWSGEAAWIPFGELNSSSAMRPDELSRSSHFSCIRRDKRDRDPFSLWIDNVREQGRPAAAPLRTIHEGIDQLGALGNGSCGRRPGHHIRGCRRRLIVAWRSSAGTAMKRLDILGSISDEPNRLTREFAGEAMRRANDQMEHGCASRHGRAPRQHRQPSWAIRGGRGRAPALIIGSHSTAS